MNKRMVIYFIISFLLVTSCNQNVICTDSKLKSQKVQLNYFSSEILKEKPALSKLLEHDSLQIRYELKDSIDTLFKNFCPSLNNSKEFEKFALLYWYNFKYQQIICCFSGVDIIPRDFLNENRINATDVGTKTMYFLLRENEIYDKTIRNGFALNNLKFPASLEMLNGDQEVMSFVSEVDDLFKERLGKY